MKTMGMAALVLVPVGWAQAEDGSWDRESRRQVFVMSGYGAALGAAAGAALWPVSGKTSTLLVGAGTGLVLGVVAGVYHVTHRNDPQNPFVNLAELTPSFADGARPPMMLRYSFSF
ncbi:MAG: hypothetical protein RJB38_650 [Pseudomonadota bacterium]|jgi:hypothetical protein